MNEINQFCGQNNGYSRSITLRNRLIPVGQTQYNLDKLNILENDKKRADYYNSAKKLIDECHRIFIQEVLEKININWKPLYEQMNIVQNRQVSIENKKEKEKLQHLQAEYREHIANSFTSNNNKERLNKLFKKDLFTDFLPNIIDSRLDASDKQQAINMLELFKNFSTYFVGFYSNRENMYSKEEKSTAISFRIVNENFPKFCTNIKLFHKIDDCFPEVIQQTEESLCTFLNGKKLKDIFSVDYYNNVLSQKGIDFYNTVIAGISKEEGTVKVQGFNEIINLTRQKLSDDNKKKLRGEMSVLYKQILSDRETTSYIPDMFDSSEKVYDSIRLFHDEKLKKVLWNIKELFSCSDAFNYDEIYVPAKEQSSFSNIVFGRWAILKDGLFFIEEGKSKKTLSEKQEEQLISQIEKKDCSLSTLQTAYEKYCERQNELVSKSVKCFFELKENDEDILKQIEIHYSEIDFNNIRNLQAEKEAVAPIKSFLDDVQKLYHYLSLVDYRGLEEKDATFYSVYDAVISELRDIIPLYNKVRNFVTKKSGEIKKYKLMFDCSSFLTSWGTEFNTKEAHLFIRDKKYYLAIVNRKLQKEDVDSLFNETDTYPIQHVVYSSQKPDFKNTIRLFTYSKGENLAPAVSLYNLPFSDIAEICANKYYKTEYRNINEHIWRESLTKIIDYFKLGFTKHDSYKGYDFKWKDSKDYNDVNEFCSDVMRSCYKITFEDLNFASLLKLVDEGKIFLFQIYNKDFAKGTSGKDNLHTIYWKNLFSEENLKNTCLRLNGEAELFYRPANKNMKIIKHSKGSILVNRTKTDGTTIPEELYQEIYKYKNSMTRDISEKAKDLLESGLVKCKEANLEIIKDKHFAEDMFLFHCPITMNFNATSNTDSVFNQRVIDVLKDNPNVKIIGLDRGERNLIYLSLINQNGEIELQKSLNLVSHERNCDAVSVNYQEKLVQKEIGRNQARKDWKTIDNIKDLKEGYLSNVIYEISKLMIENNAIVVMEDLNYKFKRGRFAVERQVYQKFENMLIEKLNFLVFKDRNILEPGGVLNAYQLTDKHKDVSEVYKQCGWLFYVPAEYTSKIDPKTGFANLFITSGLTNIEKKKEFFNKFDSIHYSAEDDCFVFSADYSKFGVTVDYKKKWDIYTHGERIVYNKKDNKTLTVYPTETLKNIFTLAEIDWKNEKNLIPLIRNKSSEKKNAPFFDGLYHAFSQTVQMRNSVPRTNEDYIISPVKSSDGSFFDSRPQQALGDKARYPRDADANGAYHIALKGLLLLKNNFNLDEKNKMQTISQSQWFEFAQKRNLNAN